MVEFMFFLLMTGITACCIERAYKEKTYWLRFYHMIPVIGMFISLGLYTYA